MGTKPKLTVAVLVTAVGLHLALRTPPAGPPRAAAIEPPRAIEPWSVVVEGAAVAPGFELSASEAAPRRLVTEQPPVAAPAASGSRWLRVILEGISEEEARLATVTLRGVEDDDWTEDLSASWPSQGLTSAFDLDPFFARAIEQGQHLDGLDVEVDHPRHFRERTLLAPTGGVQLASGQTVYEVRVRMTPPVFWPELTLSVRDAHTRAHLTDIELSCVTSHLMGTPRQPGANPEIFTSLGAGLSSPIVLRGGHAAEDPESRVAGIALHSAPGEAPQLFELWHNGRPKPGGRGMIVYARAPGHAWGSIGIDISTDGQRELLLVPGAAALGVQLTNLQHERYAPHDASAHISMWFKAEGQEHWYGSDVGSPIVRHQNLDATQSGDWLWLEGLDPGEYRVEVELGGILWGQEKPLLAREELSLTAGETRELVLALADPPPPPERAALGGTLSIPAFGGEDSVRLQLYNESSFFRSPHVEFSLADMEPVPGALPSWSFHARDLPIGIYQLQLLPFLESWMLELPAGGLPGVVLVVPELAEVLVETVDAWTGERIPLDELYHRNLDVLPDQLKDHWHRVDVLEPGRFRLWTTPGATRIWTRDIPTELGYGTGSMELELVPGLQSVRFECEPVYAFRLAFRESGAALRNSDPTWEALLSSGSVLPIGHEGRVTSFHKYREERLVEVSAAGAYEISFEGVGADRFQPIPPQLVHVRAGETAEVVVELYRK